MAQRALLRNQGRGEVRIEGGGRKRPGAHHSRGMDALEKSLLCVRLSRDRKATDPVVLDLRGLVSFTDYFVICTGRSDRQVQAIAEHLVEGLKAHQIRPRSIEGLSVGRWVLLDCDDVVVHIFQKSIREFYDLEGLWADARQVALPVEPGEAAEMEEG
jgi:ribosome silencing factor RsfS/YbeB/iojap